MSGSSPPARGTRCGTLRPQPAVRFIPACAGNTIGSSGSSTAPTVHPRLRGEHVCPFDQAVSNVGSSPPARGTHHPLPLPEYSSRFIPACAGNTAACRATLGEVAVHPRLRGEHLHSNSALLDGDGSSPPARGTLAAAERHRLRVRFIPACAGNTGSAGSRMIRSSVHPRLRGEHRSGSLSTRRQTGSSPPARGTLPSARPLRRCPRFIPACAGNTCRGGPAREVRPVHPRLRGEHSA